MYNSSSQYSYSSQYTSFSRSKHDMQNMSKYLHAEQQEQIKYLLEPNLNQPHTCTTAHQEKEQHERNLVASYNSIKQYINHKNRNQSRACISWGNKTESRGRDQPYLVVDRRLGRGVVYCSSSLSILFMDSAHPQQLTKKEKGSDLEIHRIKQIRTREHHSSYRSHFFQTYKLVKHFTH